MISFSLFIITVFWIVTPYLIVKADSSRKLFFVTTIVGGILISLPLLMPSLLELKIWAIISFAPYLLLFYFVDRTSRIKVSHRAKASLSQRSSMVQYSWRTKLVIVASISLGLLTFVTVPVIAFITEETIVAGYYIGLFLYICSLVVTWINRFRKGTTLVYSLGLVPMYVFIFTKYLVVLFPYIEGAMKSLSAGLLLVGYCVVSCSLILLNRIGEISERENI